MQLQPKNFEAAIGLGVALRGNKKIDEAEAQYNSPRSSIPSQRRPATSTSGCSTRTTRTARSRRCTRRRTTTASSWATPPADARILKREAEKRIKDIDEIYVALDEAAKMQAEAEAMQGKAEEQQKQMEEKMKQQEEDGDEGCADKAAADKAAADKKAGADKGAADKLPRAPTAKGAGGCRLAMHARPPAVRRRPTKAGWGQEGQRRRSSSPLSCKAFPWRHGRQWRL